MSQHIHRIGRFFGTDLMYTLKGGFWMNLNYFFVSLCGLITSILFARLLSKDAFGTYQYILSIAGILSALTLTGMNAAVIRAVSIGYEGELVRTTKYQLWLGAIPTLVAFTVSSWYFFNGQSGLFVSLLWIGLFLPTANALNTWTAYVAGKKQFKLGFYFSIVNTLISYGGVIAMLYFTRDFVWIAFGNFFFGLLGNIVLYTMTLKSMRPSKEINSETLPYGTHLSVIAIPNAISAQLDALLVFHFLGAATLAIYSFSTLLPEKISGALKSMSSIALPRLSEKNEFAVKDFLKKKLLWILFALAICAGLYSLVAPWLFYILFPTYIASIPFTQIYSLSFFSVGATLVQTALTSQRKTKELYVSGITIPATRAILLCVMLYYFGLWGIIWAQIIINIFAIILQMSLFKINSQSNKYSPPIV